MKPKLVTLVLATLVILGSLNLAVWATPAIDQNQLTEASDETILETAKPSNVDSMYSVDKSNQLAELFSKEDVANLLQDPADLVKKQDFANDWNEFAYIEGNMTRLVVGIEGQSVSSYLELGRIAAKYQAPIVNTVSIRGEIWAAVVELPLALVNNFIQEINKGCLASYIEPSMKVQAQYDPNDLYWSSQWGPQKIEANLAWNTTIGDPAILVAVVDTGVDYTHPDLAANYVPLGLDWANNDTDPWDDNGHGTHVSGTIAAVVNNGIGIAGLAQVRILGEKVLDSWGSGYNEWVASGIIHAVDQGADIISMSLGTYSNSKILYDAVKYAYDSGVLIVAAAGNEYTDVKLYPAGYDEVIAVSATDQWDNRAYFSNWGDWIELAAPGVDIISTVPGGYSYKSGTSMATPHVSGVAALVWSRFPNKTRDWVRLWLRYTADDLGQPGFDVNFGYGRINARQAVERVPPDHELIAYEWKTPPYVEPGGSAIINATVLNFGESNETDVAVELLANGTIADNASISFLGGGRSAAVSLVWSPMIEGLFNVTLYVVPVVGESGIENNVLARHIYAGVPLKAVVLQSSGNIDGDAITSWQVLNTEWYRFGDTMVYIDFFTLNKDDITYDDIAATDADVLIISCAFSREMGWQFTDSEIEAIGRYVLEGHGLIGTAGTFYSGVPNNNKLASLFGLDESTVWTSTGTDLLHQVSSSHPIFANVPNPLVFPGVGTALPSDARWDSNELVDGTYIALGHYQESAIVTYRGLVYISPWLEIIPPYYQHQLQLLYNAIVWSRYQRPQHELFTSLEAPKRLRPGEYELLNATVSNLGLSNETNVELQIYINSVTVVSTTIPELQVGYSYTLSHLWTPPAEERYNVTAYAPPVPGEETARNNAATKTVDARPTMYVLFDQTHATDNINSYSIWVTSLTESGYEVETNTIEPITPTVLENYDVFVIPQAHYLYGLEELQAIRDFVFNGGGLLVIGDDYTPIYTDLTGFAGITWASGGGLSGMTNDITPHEVTTGVSTVYLDIPVAIMFVTEMAQSLVRDPGGNIMLAVSEQSGGRVIGFADENSLFDYSIGQADNLRLAINMIDWLATRNRYEHDLAVTLDSPNSLGRGESTLINATVVNRGLSNETNVILQLLINGTVLDHVSIPELLTGTSRTLSYHWTPTTASTNYNVTAYALPVPEEDLTLNNRITDMVYVSLYERTYLPPQWIGGGTPMGWRWDDASFSYVLPFDFPFYNVSYRTIYISSNGLITFLEPDSSHSSSIPELMRRLAIAVAWDDWVTNDRPGDDIYIVRPDSDHVAIRWQAHAAYNRSIEANFEAILGSDGRVQLNYANSNGVVSVTTGISNGVGDFLAEDATSINYISTIVFTPLRRQHDVAVLSVTSSANQTLAGNPVDVDVVVENQGNFTESFTIGAFAESMNSTRIYLNPSDYIFDPASVSRGYRFSAELWVEDVTDLYGYQVTLKINGTLLNITNAWLPTWDSRWIFGGKTSLQPPPFFLDGDEDNSTESVLIGDVLLSADNFTGSGLLAMVEFEIIYVPTIGPANCALNIDNEDTYLLNSNIEVIPDVHRENGYYELGPEGPAPPPRLYKIGTMTVTNLAPGERVTLTFHWNTTGVIARVYLIWAEASVLTGETDIADNKCTDGTIRIMEPPSASFDYSPSYPKPSETVVFNATSSTPNGGTITSYRWNFGDENLAVTTNPIITHVYVQSGFFNVTLTVTDSEGFNDSTWRTIYVYTRDVAIVEVTPSTNQTYKGWVLSVNVTILNQGELNETFPVILFYNITAGEIIGTQIVDQLLPGEYRTLTFHWNTTNVKRLSYTITAYAMPILGETDIADNTLSSPTTVKVRWLGDINGDGKCDIKDIATVAVAFGSYVGSLRWNPEADLNRDGKVDTKDLAIVARNFGLTGI